MRKKRPAPPNAERGILSVGESVYNKKSPQNTGSNWFKDMEVIAEFESIKTQI